MIDVYHCEHCDEVNEFNTEDLQEHEEFNLCKSCFDEEPSCGCIACVEVVNKIYEEGYLVEYTERCSECQAVHRIWSYGQYLD